MNIKRTYLFPALCAAASLSAFSGTASAADCDEIQTYITANTEKVRSALAAHYGDKNHEVFLGQNAGDFTRMTITGLAIHKVSTKSCAIDVGASAKKIKVEGAAQQRRTRDGEVKFVVEFDASKGTNLCVKSAHLTSANFRTEGAVKEKIFVNNNKNNGYFSGCLF